MGGDYWQRLRTFIRDTMVAEGTIDESDLDLVRGTDSVEEALAIIRETHDRRRAAEPRLPGPMRMLGESRTDDRTP
jgi:predicted Rossmann-fold nucleotide-binding protein